MKKKLIKWLKAEDWDDVLYKITISILLVCVGCELAILLDMIIGRII